MRFSYYVGITQDNIFNIVLLITTFLHDWKYSYNYNLLMLRYILNYIDVHCYSYYVNRLIQYFILIHISALQIVDVYNLKNTQKLCQTICQHDLIDRAFQTNTKFAFSSWWWILMLMTLMLETCQRLWKVKVIIEDVVPSDYRREF